MFGRILFAVIVVGPLIEIALFIVIGQAIGLWPTLLGVLVSAIVGALVIRWQGMTALAEMQAAMRRGELPARQMGDAMLIGLAGVLLVLPGYFSDLLGLLLLLPWTRNAIYAQLARHFHVVSGTGRPVAPDEPPLIELDDTDWRNGPSL